MRPNTVVREGVPAGRSPVSLGSTGVVWCGVVWCGVVWCGVVWCGVVWYRIMSNCLMLYCVVRCHILLILRCAVSPLRQYTSWTRDLCPETPIPDITCKASWASITRPKGTKFEFLVRE